MLPATLQTLLLRSGMGNMTELLTWPPRSPDLNLTKHLCHVLDKQSDLQRPHLRTNVLVSDGTAHRQTSCEVRAVLVAQREPTRFYAGGFNIMAN